MTQASTDTDNRPNREAMRAELDAARTAFHELLQSLTAEDWKRKSANPAWSVGQLMWHLGSGIEFFGRTVEYCRRGKAPNPPSWMVATGNVLLTRFGARGATPESVAEKYDRAHEGLLAALATVQDDEWQKGARVYGTDHTIGSVVRDAIEHFAEHQADILSGLGRR